MMKKIWNSRLEPLSTISENLIITKDKGNFLFDVWRDGLNYMHRGADNITDEMAEEVQRAVERDWNKFFEEKNDVLIERWCDFRNYANFEWWAVHFCGMATGTKKDDNGLYDGYAPVGYRRMEEST